MERSFSGFLRLALGVNATFSAACGLALFLGAAGGVAAFPGVPGWLLAGIGAGLLAFALAVALAAARLRVGFAVVIGLLDLGWVCVTLPLLLVPGVIGDSGVPLVLGTALVVGGLGAVQLWAARTMMRDGETGGDRLRHCIRISSDADPEALWAVIADLGGIHRYSDALARSEMVEGVPVAPGAVRECANTQGQVWREAVEVFDPENRQLELRFLANAPGFPFPVSEMTGGWKVFPANGGAVVDVWWSLVPSGRGGWLKVALITLAMDLTMPGVVTRMTRAAGGGDADRPRRWLRPSLAYC